MKRLITVLFVITLFCGNAIAAGGLDGFLNSLNIQARADLPGFTAKVSTQFGVPPAHVQATINVVNQPADAFMIFQLGQMSGKAPETVVPVYQAKRGKGWGVIAKELGIKPGSPEFHALKRGDFALIGEPGRTHGDGHGKGKGKGKGHNK
jgi:hypothetical protein